MAGFKDISVYSDVATRIAIVSNMNGGEASLARMLGVADSTIRSYTRKNPPCSPSIDIIKRLIRKMNINPYWLFFGVEPMIAPGMEPVQPESPLPDPEPENEEEPTGSDNTELIDENKRLKEQLDTLIRANAQLSNSLALALTK